MNFDKCPRCSGEWEPCDNDGHEECLRCGKCIGHYSTSKTQIYAAGYFRCKIGNYSIHWHENGKCFIRQLNEKNGMYSPVYESQIVLNNHLPFNITEERLKLLVIFS